MTVWTSRWSDSRVIAVSNAARDDFVARGTSPRAIQVIYNGVEIPSNPPSREKARADLGLAPRSFVVLQVGRLCESKGQHLLISASSRVAGQHPDLEVLIAGADLAAGGSYRSKLEGLATAEGLGEKIRFLGVRDDIDRLLAASDVLVLPSSIEGLPLVVIEAMASARPVIASAVDGNVELVSDGETGRLIPPDDAGALAEAILAMIRNPEESRDWGSSGRAVVEERFSRGTMLRETFQVYEQLVGSG
jgi:glycosyltransferase involved in cell wall biosynthesis